MQRERGSYDYYFVTSDTSEDDDTDSDSPVSVRDVFAMIPSNRRAAAAAPAIATTTMVLDGKVDVLDVIENTMKDEEQVTDDFEKEMHALMKQERDALEERLAKLKELEEKMAKNKKVKKKNPKSKTTTTTTAVKDDSYLGSNCSSSRSRSSHPVQGTKVRRHRSRSLDASTKLNSGKEEEEAREEVGDSDKTKNGKNQSTNNESTSSSKQDTRQFKIIRQFKIVEDDSKTSLPLLSVGEQHGGGAGPLLYSDKVYGFKVDAPDEVQRIKEAKLLARCKTKERRKSERREFKKMSSSTGDLYHNSSKSDPSTTQTLHNSFSGGEISSRKAVPRRREGHHHRSSHGNNNIDSRSRRESRSLQRKSSSRSLNSSASSNLDDDNTTTTTRSNKSQRGSRTVARSPYDLDDDSISISKSRRESRSLQRKSSSRSLNSSASSNLDDRESRSLQCKSSSRSLNSSASSNLDDDDDNNNTTTTRSNKSQRGSRTVARSITKDLVDDSISISKTKNPTKSNKSFNKSHSKDQDYSTISKIRSRRESRTISLRRTSSARSLSLSDHQSQGERQSVARRRLSNNSSSSNDDFDFPTSPLGRSRHSRGSSSAGNSPNSASPGGGVNRRLRQSVSSRGIRSPNSSPGGGSKRRMRQSVSSRGIRHADLSPLRELTDEEQEVPNHLHRISDGPAKNRKEKKETRQRGDFGATMPFSMDDLGLGMDDSLRGESDEDDSEEEEPVVFKNKRMSMMGRTGPRMTANVLREKLKLAAQEKEAKEAKEANDEEDNDTDEKVMDNAEEEEASEVAEVTTGMDATNGSGEARVDPRKGSSVSTVDTSDCKGTAAGRASFVVVPCTTHKAMPKRRSKKGILYDAEFSDLYDDEESLLYGL